MSVKDIADVLVVEQASFSTPWTEAMFANELISNPRAHYLVVEVSQKIVGYVGFWQVLDEGHITNIAIHPDYRRHGYAKTLIEFMFNYAKTMKIERMTLEVRVSNIPAQHLYKGFGFKVAGERKRYYTDNGENALIMWLGFNEENE